jgi:hypothetical protein
MSGQSVWVRSLLGWTLAHTSQRTWVLQLSSRFPSAGWATALGQRLAVEGRRDHAVAHHADGNRLNNCKSDVHWEAEVNVHPSSEPIRILCSDTRAGTGAQRDGRERVRSPAHDLLLRVHFLVQVVQRLVVVDVYRDLQHRAARQDAEQQ